MTRRIFNAGQACTILAIEPYVLTKWIKEGMPTVPWTGDARSNYGIDLALVMKWRCEKHAADLLETLGLAGDGASTAMTAKHAKDRKLAADAIVAEIKADTELGNVARWQDMAEAVTLLFSEVRNQLQGVGSKVAGHAAVLDDAPSIQDLIDQAVVDALEGLDADAILNR